MAALLFLSLMLCAVVFSPLCIIFSNTIIVLSLLSSSVESSPFKILLDTGTAFYVLRQPLNTTMFNQLTQSISFSDTECLYLLIDTTNANFTGTPEYPRNCVQSVGNSAANVSLDVMSSGRLMHVFHYL